MLVGKLYGFLVNCQNRDKILPGLRFNSERSSDEQLRQLRPWPAASWHTWAGRPLQVHSAVPQEEGGSSSLPFPMPEGS